MLYFFFMGLASSIKHLWQQVWNKDRWFDSQNLFKSFKGRFITTVLSVCPLWASRSAGGGGTLTARGFLPFEDIQNHWEERDGPSQGKPPSTCPMGLRGSVFWSQQVFPESLCSFHRTSETKKLPALCVHLLTSSFCLSFLILLPIMYMTRFCFTRGILPLFSFWTHGRNLSLVLVVS